MNQKQAISIIKGSGYVVKLKIHEVPRKFYSQRGFILACVKEHGDVLCDLPSIWSKDLEILEIAAKTAGYLLAALPKESRAKRFT